MIEILCNDEKKLYRCNLVTCKAILTARSRIDGLFYNDNRMKESYEKQDFFPKINSEIYLYQCLFTGLKRCFCTVK